MEGRERTLAWGVHVLTASGAVLAFLALIAVEAGSTDKALLWLFAALVIDGVDGSLARAVKVRERMPRISGESLDLVVDYLTYVFVPAMLIWQGGYLPKPLALPLTAAILVSSLYVFAREDMKTEDGYFRGFPALWNLVAFYFVATEPSTAIAAAVTVALIALTFAPIHVVHPFRVTDFGEALPIVAVAWGATTAALLVPGWSVLINTFLLLMSLGTAGALVALGLLRTVRGPKRAQ